MTSYLAFDIEIAKLLPDGQEDWKAYHPLGITCAATYSGEGKPRVWYGKDDQGQAAGQMSQLELGELVSYLQRMAAAGYTLLTWNGAGFDFNILAEESGAWQACARMASEHVDMMFHIFCLRGHTLGLDKAAKGMGLPGKPMGMSGELAPRYWAEGKWAVVLDYVAQDVRTTYDLAIKVEREKELRWKSERGLGQTIPLPGGWLSVSQALKLPEPDTSWMRQPWPRSKFVGWINDWK